MTKTGHVTGSLTTKQQRPIRKMQVNKLVFQLENIQTVSWSTKNASEGLGKWDLALYLPPVSPVIRDISSLC